MQGLPDKVKCLLCALTWMDELSTDQVLAQAITKDEVMEEGLAVAAMQTTWDKMRKFPTGDLCVFHAIVATVLIILQKITHQKVETPNTRIQVQHGAPYIRQLSGENEQGE